MCVSRSIKTKNKTKNKEEQQEQEEEETDRQKQTQRETVIRIHGGDPDFLWGREGVGAVGRGWYVCQTVNQRKKKTQTDSDGRGSEAGVKRK